jgi:uncharacterized membrane protein YczE
MTYAPDDLLAVFESAPVFPDERAWFWKWLVLAIGCVLLLALASAIVLWPAVAARRSPKIYRLLN